MLQHATLSVGAAPHQEKIWIVSLAVNLKPNKNSIQVLVCNYVFSCAYKYLTENVKRNKTVRPIYRSTLYSTVLSILRFCFAHKNKF